MVCRNTKYTGKDAVLRVAIGCGDAIPSEAEWQIAGAMRTKSQTAEWETADGTTDDSIGSLRDNLATYLGFTVSGDGVLRRPGLNLGVNIVRELEKHFLNPIATGGQPTAWFQLVYPDLTFTVFVLLTSFGREAPMDDVATFSFEASAKDTGAPGIPGLMVEDTPDPDAAAPAIVSVIPSPLNLVVGQSYNMEGAVVPAGASQALLWTSSDPTIAAVNPTNGVVTGLAVGGVQITATSRVNPALSASSSVEVQPQVATIDVSPSLVEVEVGATQQLTPEVLPAGAHQGVSYASLNPAVATVSAGGLVTGVAVGSTSVKVSSQGRPSVARTIAVTVSA